MLEPEIEIKSESVRVKLVWDKDDLPLQEPRSSIF